jgi:hypothetical protein
VIARLVVVLVAVSVVFWLVQLATQHAMLVIAAAAGAGLLGRHLRRAGA